MIVETNETLWQQARTQGRVIWALTMREVITRFGREGLGAIWLFVEPAMFIVGVTFIFSHIDQGATYSIAEYMAMSYPTLLLWRNGSNRVVKALEINRALLHHQPIRPFDIIYSRILLEFSGIAAASTVLYFIYIALGICQFPNNVLTMALGYLLVVWFSFNFVLIMSALADMSESIERISHIIIYLMLPFTGVFIPLFVVPEPYRGWLMYFPLIDAVEYFHHGYYGARFQTYYDIPYTLFALLAMSLFALTLMKKSIRKFISD